MVSRPLPVIFLALALAACADGATLKIFEPVVVKEAVAIKATPPAELMQPYKGAPLPIWVNPGSPEASACLPLAAVGDLLGIINDLLGRDAAWREWAATKLPPAPPPVKP